MRITTSQNFRARIAMNQPATTPLVLLFVVAILGGVQHASAFQQQFGGLRVVAPVGPKRQIQIGHYSPRRQHLDYIPPLCAIEVQNKQATIVDTVQVIQEEESVPSEMSDAIRIFFFSQDYGPLFVVMSIVMFLTKRIQLSSIGVLDGVVFGATVMFWSVQEHFLHEKVLHSKQDWAGKQIHQAHHDKPYYHISIDPAILLLGWMAFAHLFLKWLLPLPLALSATVGYSMAGLFYEWAHYIVHTKVRFGSSFWKRVKENHIRHHLVNHDYWFAFSLPWIDDLFGTNPSVKDVKRQMKQGQ
jgi:hypothetical protein